MGQCFSKPSEKKAPPPATEVNGPGAVSPQDINVGINSPVRPLPPPPAKSGIAANWSFISTLYNIFPKHIVGRLLSHDRAVNSVTNLTILKMEIF